MKKTIILTTIFFTALASPAQITVPGDIPSPNAAELGEFGNVPVSYFTGKADISIPLYSLTARGTTLPVYLAYNAGGVLVNKLPGWTGDNWALCAGGVITRVKQGQYDELVYPERMGNFVLSKTMRNYFQSYHSLQKYLATPANNYSQLKDSVANDLRDLAPDIYHFNFMGHIGQFFLGNDGQWKVCSDENIEVVFDYMDDTNFIPPFIANYPPPYNSIPQPKTIKGFVLRDDTGLEYHFGGSSNFIEYTIPLRFMGNREILTSWAASSWYLREVKDRLGNTLFSLQYERGYNIVQLYNNAYVTKQSSSASGLSSATICSNYNGTGGFPYDGVVNSPLYLKSIISADGNKLEFRSTDWDKFPEEIYYGLYASYQTYNNLLSNMGIGSYAYYYLSSDDAEPLQYQYRTNSGKDSDNPQYNPFVTTRLRKLDAIRLVSPNGGVVSQDSLSYFSGYRLRLSKVYIRDRNNAAVGRYDLTYSPATQLEDYLSKQEDHWGYLTSSSYTLPAYNNTFGMAAFYSLRNPSTYSTKGMLTQIVYPTGGRSVFEYENHDFSSYVTSNRSAMTDSTAIAGGVRIKSITEYEDNTTLHMLRKRTFTYEDPYTSKSSGQLYSLPRYYWESWRAYNRSSNTQSYLSLFKSTSILPLSSSFGPHVGYSYVRETFEDGTYKEYRYSNLSSARDYSFFLDFSNGSVSPYDLYSSQEYRRGRLLSVRTCEPNGSVRQLQEYQYRTDNVESNYVLTTNLTCESYVNTLLNSFDHFTGGVFKLFFPKYDVVGETNTTYYPSGNVTDHIAYERADRSLAVSYLGHAHQVNVRTTTSITSTRNGLVSKETFTYPFNINSGVEPMLSGYDFYLQPIGVEHKIDGVIASKRQTAFRNQQGYLVPKYEIEWKNGLAADTLVTYLTYNPANGNLLTYREQGKPVTTLEWDSNGCLLTKKQTGDNHIVEVNYSNSKPYYIKNVNGVYNYFEYDTMGRLSAKRGSYGKEKEFFYNYKNK